MTLAEELVNVPKQLFVRCNFCNESLPLNVLRRQESTSGNSWLTQNSWLTREPPVLKCCPACRKPLPRCYVCLLSLGCLNPYLELKRQRELKRGGGGSSETAKEHCVVIPGSRRGGGGEEKKVQPESGLEEVRRGRRAGAKCQLVLYFLTPPLSLAPLIAARGTPLRGDVDVVQQVPPRGAH